MFFNYHKDDINQVILPSNSNVIYYSPVPQTTFKSRECHIKRNILKARRKIKNLSYVCVIDTNVLIDNLESIKSLVESNSTNVEKTNCDKSKLKIKVEKLIVPWVVLQELDGLKMANKTSCGNNAQLAIKFLNEQLKRKEKSLIKGEIDANSGQTSNTQKLTIKSNDDKILDCCLRMNNEYNMDQYRVILLSNDRNLQNKALVYNISSYSINEFNNQFAEFSEMKYKFLAKNVDSANISSESANDETVKPNSAKRRKNEHSQSTMKANYQVTSQELTQGLSNQNLTARHEQSNSLVEFCIDKLKSTFGEKWNTVFPKFKGETASQMDCLNMMKNNWIGVFSDFFNRNQTVLDLLNWLTNRKNESNQKLFDENLKRLRNFIQNIK